MNSRLWLICLNATTACPESGALFAQEKTKANPTTLPCRRKEKKHLFISTSETASDTPLKQNTVGGSFFKKTKR
jgi:hypothetical protein